MQTIHHGFSHRDWYKNWEGRISIAIPTLQVPYSVYFILPIHEERIGRVLRPIAFAHICTGEHSWDTATRAAWDTPKIIENMANNWTHILAPIGEQIGHSLFDRMLDSHIEHVNHLRSGYFIAHELNVIVNKQGKPLFDSAFSNDRAKLGPLQSLFTRLSTFADLACMLGDVSLPVGNTGSSHRGHKAERQLRRLFMPILKVRSEDADGATLCELTSSVAYKIYNEASDVLDISGVSLSIAPNPTDVSKKEPGSPEWESLVLILREMIWNFIRYCTDTGDGTGTFTSMIDQDRFICRLVQHYFKKTHAPRSMTFDYLSAILAVSGCGIATHFIEDHDLVWEIDLDLSYLVSEAK